MNAAEKRAAVIAAYKTILGRNIYSQDAVKREKCFTPHTDGKYYSDCSSSIRLSYKKAGIGLNNIGGNTVGMYQNKAGVKVPCNIVNGIPKDVSALRIGDCLLFAGSDSSRAYADYVGHVEMVAKIAGNAVTLYGHGSGNPSSKAMVAYCKNRQATKTSTKKGNRGLLKVVRFIPDDKETTVTPPTTTNPPIEPPTTTDSATNAKIIWDHLIGKGFKPEAVAGIMGNLQAESSLMPMNLQNTFNTKLGMTDAQYTADVDSGKYTNFEKDGAGYGIVQWTYSTRKAALLARAKKNNKSIGNLTMQLNHMVSEMQAYTKMMNVLNGNPTIRQASDSFLTTYERPADQSEAVKIKRAGYGQAFFDKFANKVETKPEPGKEEPVVLYTVQVMTTGKLNVRKGPGKNYGITGTVNGGSTRYIVEEAKATDGTKWGKLKSGKGWISLSYCAKT